MDRGRMGPRSGCVPARQGARDPAARQGHSPLVQAARARVSDAHQRRAARFHRSAEAEGVNPLSGVPLRLRFRLNRFRNIGMGARMIDKFVRSVAEALAGIKDGSTVLIAGFAQVGEPRALIDGLIETGAKDLTVVHNTAGRGREGVARLIGEGRVRKIVCSFARSRGSVLFEEVFARGGIELEILPQGTMAERMRAAAAGIPAFYTATGAGTKLAEGKEARVFNGRECILEHALPGDVALIDAW